MDEETRQKVMEHRRKERERQEDLESLRKMRPMDDAFARAMLRDNIPLAQMMLRIVMGKPDLIITELKTQADMNCAAAVHGRFALAANRPPIQRKNHRIWPHLP